MSVPSDADRSKSEPSFANAVTITSAPSLTFSLIGSQADLTSMPVAGTAEARSGPRLLGPATTEILPVPVASMQRVLASDKSLSDMTITAGAIKASAAAVAFSLQFSSRKTFTFASPETGTATLAETLHRLQAPRSAVLPCQL